MWDHGCCSVRKPRSASVLDESPQRLRSNGSSCSQSPGDLPAESHQATVGSNRALGHQVVGVFVRQQKRYIMKTLKDVKIGETVRVTKVGGEGALKRRIMDMGITKGVSIKVMKVAPLGDPVEITVRGYELTLRKADCEKIEVE